MSHTSVTGKGKQSSGSDLQAVRPHHKSPPSGVCPSTSAAESYTAPGKIDPHAWPHWPSSKSHSFVQEWLSKLPARAQPTPPAAAATAAAAPCKDDGPFPASFYDEEDDSEPWYDRLKADKLCLLGFLAMLSYDDDDYGDLGIACRLLPFGVSPYAPFSGGWIRFKLLQKEFITARIVQVDVHNKDWHLQPGGGLGVRSLTTEVIAGLKKTRYAFVVFAAAKHALRGMLSSLEVISQQLYLNVLQMAKVYDQLFPCHDETHAPKVDSQHWDNADLEGVEQGRDFLRLIRGMKERLHDLDSRQGVLKAIAKRIEARVGKDDGDK